MNIKLSLVILAIFQFLLSSCFSENKADRSSSVPQFEDSQVYKIDLKFCGNKDDILFADQNGCIIAPTVYHWLKDKEQVKAILVKKSDFRDLQPEGKIHYQLAIYSQGCFLGNPIPNEHQFYSVGKTQVIVDPDVVNADDASTWDEGIKLTVTPASREEANQNSSSCEKVSLNN